MLWMFLTPVIQVQSPTETLISPKMVIYVTEAQWHIGMLSVSGSKGPRLKPLTFA